MFSFCLTSGVAAWYNAKCIGEDTSKMPVSVKETSGQVCSHCLMQLATVRQIWLWRIWSAGGESVVKAAFCKTKNGTRASCARLALHHDSLAAAMQLRCRGLRRRVTKNNCLLALWPRFAGSRRQLSLFITGGHCDRLRWSLLLPPLFLLRSYAWAKAVISIPFFGHIITISVHRKVVFYGLFVLFRATYPSLSDVG